MRILVYLLTLLMVFAPTYSAYASGITKGQITQMGKQGGALVKTGAGKLVKLGKVGHPIATVGAAMAWCAKYKKKCDEIVDETVEIACDISGVCTAERKESTDNCLTFNGKDYSTFVSSVNYTERRYNTDFRYSLSQEGRDLLQRVIDNNNRGIRDVGHKTVQLDRTYETSDGRRITDKIPTNVNVNDTCDDNKITQDDLNQLAKKIADNMDDDDIINYYNTDYDDITINNYHYYGDNIDNETNIDNQCQNNSCNEISKEIEKDVKNGKYDIDDVTPANCTMEENTGKYIACNMNIENEEDNTNNDNTNKKDGDNTDIPKKEDDDPLSCDSSKFHKKICDWMDWTQDDLEVPDEEKPKIKDLAEDLAIKKDRVRFNAQCPSPKEISITVSGQGFSEHLNYQPFCDLMTKSKPFVIGISGISALLIVAGSLRR